MYLKKETPVRDYDRTQYTTDACFAQATDGTQIPISIIRKSDTNVDSSRLCCSTVMGHMDTLTTLRIRSSWFSLLDRGMTIGIAHVRGGGEYGRQWKLDGKLEKKVNTFTDFIACAEHLIEKGYSHPKKLVIEGRSAGGLLMGAVMNMRLRSI